MFAITLPMKRTQKLKLPTSYALALSPSGDRIAALGRNVVTGDTTAMRRLSSCHPLSHPSHASFNSDGTLLAVKSTSGRIVLLNPTTGTTEVDFANDADGEGSNIAFSAGGNVLVDASWDGVLKIRDVRTCKVVQEFNYPGEMITELSCSADGQTWAFLHKPKATECDSVPAAPYVSVWQWPLSSPHYIRMALDLADAAVISPDGSSLAVSGYCRASKKTLVRILDIEGKCLSECQVDRCKSLRWSPCGTLIGRVGKSEIAVHFSESLAQSKSFELAYPSAVAFAPDLSFIALGSWNGGVVQPFEQ
jgi:WD40 repeat protein